MKKREINKDRSTKRDYINGKQLYDAIVDYYENGNMKSYEFACVGIKQIVERLATKSNFRDYTYIDEMIGNGIEMAFKAFIQRKFNVKYENPFAYFTQIAYNEFIRVIKIEHREVYIKHKELENYMVNASLQGEVVALPDDDASGRINDLVDKFEKKKNEK